MSLSSFDVYSMVIFGFVGYVFVKFNCEAAPMLLTGRLTGRSVAVVSMPNNSYVDAMVTTLTQAGAKVTSRVVLTDKFTDPNNNRYNPWIDEGMFKVRFAEQPSYITPPIAFEGKRFLRRAGRKTAGH